MSKKSSAEFDLLMYGMTPDPLADPLPDPNKLDDNEDRHLDASYEDRTHLED